MPSVLQKEARSALEFGTWGITQGYWSAMDAIRLERIQTDPSGCGIASGVLDNPSIGPVHNVCTALSDFERREAESQVHLITATSTLANTTALIAQLSTSGWLGTR